ncbi:purine-binding chemotaxis protein CheW [Candidatus Gastranaerophilus sp. (ex Termes propinquus)]|nr:purine-binding chemotaxis protein CheW [Candidatus Gastranaerophilus sp. (ex Termes propinquus)]
MIITQVVCEVTMSEFKLLTFLLDDESYGIPITKVKEIIGMLAITKIPHAPKFLKGIINLRGSVIPVVDLRLKLGLEEIGYNDKTCILIVNINEDGAKEKPIGVIVDVVSEVLTMMSEDIDNSTNWNRGASKDTDYIQGIGKLQDKNLIILDIEKMFSSHELVSIAEMHA